MTGRDPTLMVIGSLFFIVALTLFIVPYRSELRETVTTTLSTMLLTFSWVKVIYSVILISIIVILASEIRRVWLDSRTTIGSFNYIEDAVEKKDIGKSLGLSVIERHSDLRWRFANVNPPEFEAERQLLPATGEPIERAETVLTDLQITVQDIPVTNILEKLRRWISGPRELTGTISKLGNEYRASLSLVDPNLVLADGRQLPSTLHFQGSGDIGQIAFDLACSLIWLDAAKVGEDIATIGREEFCDWTMRWTQYQSLARVLRRNGKLTDTDVKRIEDALAALTHAIDNGARYPKFWSLRADFSNLLPQEKRAPLLARIQNDQLTYLTMLRLDAKSTLMGKNELDEAEAYRVLAEARPALAVGDGVVIDEAKYLWSRALSYDASQAAIKRAALATGMFNISSTSSTGPNPVAPAMGFAIGPNLIATMAYSVFEEGLRPGDGSELVVVPDDYTAEFVFADAWPDDPSDTRPRLPIKRILYISDDENTRPELALLEIERHDVTAFPPLKLDIARNIAVSIGEFVFLIGFPYADVRLPSEFMTNLLGDRGGGIKRIMPGLVLTVPAPGTPSNASVLSGGSIVVDASTSGGTGGAPLISLSTGRLVGINVAGQWQTLRDGKFAYVRPVSWMFGSEELRSYISGNADRLSLDEITKHIPDLATRDVDQVAALVEPETETETSVSEELEPDSPFIGEGYREDFLSEPLPLPTTPEWTEVVSDPLDYIRHSIVMHKERRFPLFAAENVDGARLLQLKRSGRWVRDPRLDAVQQSDNSFYSRNVFDRGHLVRPSNVTWGDRETATRAEMSAYVYTNATPQHQDFNQRTWLELEDGILSFLDNNDLKATIFSGPVFSDTDPEYRSFRVPLAYWKILIAEVDGKLKAVGYVLRQDISIQGDDILGNVEPFDVVNSQVTIKEVEALTGLDFGIVRDLPTLNFYGTPAN